MWESGSTVAETDHVLLEGQADEVESIYLDI